MSLDGIDLQTAKHLASDPRLKAKRAWHAADSGALGAIDLCKTALLLPAVLAAPMPLDAQLPARARSSGAMAYAAA